MRGSGEIRIALSRAELTAVREAVELTPNFEGRLDVRDTLRAAVKARSAGVAIEREVAERFVKRLAATFPVDVELSGADAMLESRRIAAGQQLEVVARIALGGTPTATSGDPFGQVSYHVGKDGKLNIVIDRLSP